jgi:phosphatidylinositol-4,5-bisphosphate 3-kinase catalytic subunit alpha/beta/delta
MPFIFTEQMKFAIGNRFNEFESLACDAYKTLRRHANLLITMFSLMVSSGMPELMTDDDITWLRDKLMLDSAEDAAADHFKTQIEAAYKNTRVKLNDAAHLLKHVG